jgi:hypothetical protein
MVLIETDNNDSATFHVLEWMKYYGVDYYTITPNEVIGICLRQNDEITQLTIGNKSFNLSNISGYWFRRGLFEVRMEKNASATARAMSLS